MGRDVVLDQRAVGHFFYSPSGDADGVRRLLKNDLVRVVQCDGTSVTTFLERAGGKRHAFRPTASRSSSAHVAFRAGVHYRWPPAHGRTSDVHYRDKRGGEEVFVCTLHVGWCALRCTLHPRRGPEGETERSLWHRGVGGIR